jgi:hypothetical protein
MHYNGILTERMKVPETMVEIVEVNGSLPLKHQLGKLLVATVVAFAATKVAERAYDAALTSYQNRTMNSGA